MMKRDKAFEQTVRQLLDDSIEELDPAISRRLQQARARALEANGRRFVLWRPAVAFAMSVLLLLAVVFWPTAQHGDSLAPLMADMELIAADDSLQLIEDLEFYQWLLETGNNAG